MTTIKLINGPYNGREIEDSGAVKFLMGLGNKVGDRCGMSIYEPNPERTLAFWLQNDWDGTIDDIIEA